MTYVVKYEKIGISLKKLELQYKKLAVRYPLGTLSLKTVSEMSLVINYVITINAFNILISFL